MAENKKVYTIQINGVKESIDAIDSLNKTLNTLDTKIKELESKTVTVSSKGGSSSVLSEEAALQREINNLKNEGTKLDAKIAATQSEVYQKVQATKDLYKEAVNDQKQLAAQERLTADAYSNTMAGMKQHLADLKAVINTTDLGDSDSIKKMTKEANELTNKLKEMEEAYGQFGRNVGNYQSAFDGLQKISVVVNGVTQEFTSLRQAQRALTNAMGTLEVNGKKDTAMYKQMEKELEKVAKAQLRLNSAMNDAKASSKAMDDMLDMFESFTALEQVGRGFSTFFGIDDSEIEKQIAKLVALQNTLQGIEKIRQQMNTGEGIGGIMNSGSDAVDKFVMKLTGAQKRMGMLVTTTKEGSIVVQRLAAGLKIVGGATIIGGIMLLTTAFSKIMEDFKRWKNGGYEAGTATEVLNKQLEEQKKILEWYLNNQKRQYLEGLIDSETYANNVTNILTINLSNLLNKLGELEKRDFSKISGSILGGFNLGYGKTEGEALKNAQDRFKKLAEELDKIENKTRKSSSFVGWVKDLVGLGPDVDRLEREFQDLGESLSKNILYDLQNTMSKARAEIATVGTVSEETREKIYDLSIELTRPTTNSILSNIDKFSKNGQYYANQINLIKDEIEQIIKEK